MVAMRDIQNFADRIAEEYQPDRIILFGSYATGTPGPDSDVDLLVIMPDGGDSLGKAAENRSQIPVDFAVDVLVRNSEDLQWRLTQKDWFLLNVLKNGKTLHAAPKG